LLHTLHVQLHVQIGHTVFFSLWFYFQYISHRIDEFRFRRSISRRRLSTNNSSSAIGDPT
jgi:hypothetical protein